MLGSGGVIVIAEGTCMVKALSILTRFYHHESCGQCTPCRDGTSWMENIIDRIEKGEGSLAELDKLLAICKTIEFNTICPLGDAAVAPVRSFIQKFRGEFEQHIHQKKCPFGNRFKVWHS
jgi:NADH-quinone oxidoreductase subunit F